MNQNVAAQKPPLIRHQAIEKLPFLSQKEKDYFVGGLKGLWAVLDDETKPEDMKQKARAKIQDVSKMVMMRVRASGAPARPASQGGQQEAQADTPQLNASPDARVETQGAAAPQVQGPSTLPPQQPPQQAQAQGQQQQQSLISPAVQNGLNNFRIYPPANVHPQNNPQEYEAHKFKVKRSLQQSLITSERCQTRQKELLAQEQKLQQAGQQLPPQLQQQKEQLAKIMASTQVELNNIKAENERNKMHWTHLQTQSQTNQTAAGTGGQGQGPQTASQQQQQQQAPMQLQIPQQTATVNPVTRPPQNLQQPGFPSQQNQASAPASALSQQSAGTPQALSHQAAITAVARTYSDQQQQQQTQPLSATLQQHTSQGQSSSAVPQSGSQPQSQRDTLVQGTSGQTFPPSTMPSQSSVNQKMPIPQKLNVTTPTPVSMGPSRPTLGGLGSSGPPGMMGQPAIAKPPGFILEGESERVLSKKKLDELVRQVTGCGEGDGLTPDVEEAVLNLADDFVDNVITSACRLAKIRPNSTLDVRDIQIVLERNYNIRVPGYSLDEVRTVRKFQPAPGWTQKMNAVQAAKVMGKNDV